VHVYVCKPVTGKEEREIQSALTAEFAQTTGWDTHAICKGCRQHSKVQKFSRVEKIFRPRQTNAFMQ